MPLILIYQGFQCGLLKLTLFSEKAIGRLMKPYHEEMLKNNCTLSRKDIHNKISRSKGKGFDPDEHIRDLLAHVFKNVPEEKRDENMLTFGQMFVVRIWREYEGELRRSNLVDFDDLLIFGVRLVKGHKKVVNWCRHILADE
jgi:DNA helicase-2/ATP-dependent DNA helicase PcrA